MIFNKLFNFITNTKYILVKDSGEILCKEATINYESGSPQLDYEGYSIKKFSSKDAIKNFNYSSKCGQWNSYFHQSIKYFRTKAGALDFLRNEIDNKDEWRASTIDELDLPLKDKMTI